jgi:hypothetical protein
MSYPLLRRAGIICEYIKGQVYYSNIDTDILFYIAEMLTVLMGGEEGTIACKRRELKGLHYYTI